MYTHNYYRENEADRILAAIVRDDRPHYKTERIIQKARTDHRRCKDLSLITPPRCEATHEIRRRTVQRVLEASKLTRRQLEVLLAKVQGDSWLQIGRRFGYSRQAAQGIFKQALRKVRKAWVAYPFAGLEEVYRKEVSRYAQRRR
jgi:hypothetical protein